MKKQLLWVAGAACLTIGLTFGSAGVYANENTEDTQAESTEDVRIADGVYIGAVDVGGLTGEEAEAAIGDYVDGLMSTSFTLTGANGSIEATAGDMGITADVGASVDEALAVTRSGSLINRFKQTKDLESSDMTFPLVLEVNKQETAALLYRNRASLSLEAVDGTLTRENGEFNFVEGTPGQELDEVASVYAINSFLAYDYDGSNTQIDLVCNEVEPRGTAEQLAVIKDCLGTFSTNYSSSASGRKANVANAASKIDGTVIYPGEEFSVYTAISPMTEENGYEIAGAYENGTVVDSVGGGVCQVASTLYNAVIRAELDVTMRYNHSMLVSYVEPSDDAAIAGTYKDLRFVNNTDYPVYIAGSADGNNLIFSIYGVETRPENRTVSFESVTVSQDDPTYQFNLDASQALGYYHVEQGAHLGTVAELYKIVTVDGVEQSRERFNTSTYKAAPRTITVGTAGCTEEQLAAINAAIAEATATGDESIVQAAIAQAQGGGDDTDDGEGAGEGDGGDAENGGEGDDGGNGTEDGEDTGNGGNTGNGGTDAAATGVTRYAE